MINAILFVLLKCFLFRIGLRIMAKTTLSFISSYERRSDNIAGVLAILVFLCGVGFFSFGVYDIVTDVIAMGGTL